MSGESCYDQSTFQPFDAEFPAVYRKIIMDGFLFAELVFALNRHGCSLSLGLFPRTQSISVFESASLFKGCKRRHKLILEFVD